MTELIGQTLGPFEIISELGRGGMAVVYKARQTDLQRTVALKILPPELSRDQSYLQRFLHEARSAAALEHPHIVPIYAIGEAQGFHYIAMKFITGRTLKEVAEERGALDLAEAAALLEQVAGALDYAHSRGLIHRDIKPSNMMAEPNGWVYLTDFGLARGGENSQGLTLAGTVMGTPEYMSPEQAQGLATIGPATDIYALGVVVYELLTGQVPFAADTPMGMLVARLQHSPRPPRDYRGDLPLAVEDVIMRALARRPEARFATAGELVVALKQAAGLGTRTLSPQQRPASPAQGLPAAPVSPAFGAPVAPTQPAHASQPPAIPAPPAATPPPIVAARPATPLPAAGFGGLPTTPAAPAMPAPAARSRRGLWMALGAIGLVIALAFMFDLLVLRGDDPAIAKGLQEGQTALAQPGGLAPAIAAYKRVLAADTNNVQAHNQLALIYSLRDLPRQAESEARAALAADDKSALARALLAEALSNQGKYQDALEAANRAIELNDKLAFAFGVRAGIQANIAFENSDADLLDTAARDADQSVELAKSGDALNQALAHSARGYVAYQRFALADDNDALEKGIDEMKQAIELQGQIAMFHANLGYFYDAQGEHDSAQKAFESALAADDQYGHTHAGLGWNLYYLGDYAGALGEFDKAIEMNAEDVDAYVGKSYAFQAGETPDYDQGAAALAKAAAVAPSNPNVPANMGWLQRARASNLEQGGDAQKRAYAEAEQQFRKALTLNQNYVDALTGLGWVLQDQADVLEDDAKYRESVDVLKQSLALKETQPGANNAIGWSYYNLKQYDDAERSFRRAIELNDEYANAYYGLGRTLQDLGQADKAREAYQQAADNGSTEANEALSSLP